MRAPGRERNGQMLIGNGSATTANVADDLGGAHLEVKHRDLSHTGASSPSVHNKFLVERNPATGHAVRVLTGSTTTDRPSEAAYTAADRPAGPAP